MQNDKTTTVESFREEEDDLIAELNAIESPKANARQHEPPGPVRSVSPAISPIRSARKLYNPKPSSSLRVSSPLHPGGESRTSSSDSQDSLAQLSKQVNIATKAIISTVSSSGRRMKIETLEQSPHHNRNTAFCLRRKQRMGNEGCTHAFNASVSVPFESPRSDPSAHGR